MTGAILTKFALAPTTWTMVVRPSASRLCGVPGTRTRFGVCVALISGAERTQATRALEDHPRPSTRCHYPPGQRPVKVFTAGPVRRGRLLPSRRRGFSPIVLGAREGN